MDTACRAVAQAGIVAATASLDSEQPWPLLLVAGWLTTAADAALADGLLADLDARFAAELTRRPAA